MTRAATVLALAVLAGSSLVGSSPGGRTAVGAAPRADAPSGAGRTSPSRYSAPVTPVHVLRRFQPPPTPYSAGHRGVDLATPAGGLVRAAGAGRVSFAGPVAGRGVVVIAHPDGVRSEYEPITPTVRAGAAVARGQPIGHVRGAHGSCPVDRCLHWGARRDGVYFDPLTLLQALGPVRLLPWSGRPP